MIIINLTGERADRHRFLSYLRNSLEQKNFMQVKDENLLKNNSFYYKLVYDFIIEKIIFQHDNKKYCFNINIPLSKKQQNSDTIQAEANSEKSTTLPQAEATVEVNQVQNLYVCTVRTFNADLATNDDIVYVDDKKCFEGLNTILDTKLFAEATKRQNTYYPYGKLNGIFSLANSPQANPHDKTILVKSSP